MAGSAGPGTLSSSSASSSDDESRRRGMMLHRASCVAQSPSNARQKCMQGFSRQGLVDADTVDL